MAISKQTFPALHSTYSKLFTRIITGFGLFCSVFVPVSMAIMTVIVFNTRRIDVGLKILMLIVTVLLILFFVWLILVQIKERHKKGRITEIIINGEGMHYYSRQQLITTIRYTELFSNPEESSFDVFIHFIPESEVDINWHLCIFLYDESQGKAVRKYLTPLQIDVLITNGTSLIAYFIKGIMTFRPDLKVEPDVLTFYGI